MKPGGETKLRPGESQVKGLQSKNLGRSNNFDHDSKSIERKGEDEDTLNAISNKKRTREIEDSDNESFSSSENKGTNQQFLNVQRWKQPEGVGFTESDSLVMLRGATRAEKKRYREQRRRVELNRGLDQLATLLYNIEPSLKPGPSSVGTSGKLSGADSSDGGSASIANRVELINCAVAVLQRVHEENESRKVLLRSLTGEDSITSKSKERRGAEKRLKVEKAGSNDVIAARDRDGNAQTAAIRESRPSSSSSTRKPTKKNRITGCDNDSSASQVSVSSVTDSRNVASQQGLRAQQQAAEHMSHERNLEQQLRHLGGGGLHQLSQFSSIPQQSMVTRMLFNPSLVMPGGTSNDISQLSLQGGGVANASALFSGGLTDTEALSFIRSRGSAGGPNPSSSSMYQQLSVGQQSHGTNNILGQSSTVAGASLTSIASLVAQGLLPFETAMQYLQQQQSGQGSSPGGWPQNFNGSNGNKDR